ncbi:phage tail protein [Pseudomonas sp. A1437]|uniref:Kelch repeat-containing protein n=1 Tax=unclassified Pseudomonas TaxID=196821 RepID=UPI0037833EAB
MGASITLAGESLISQKQAARQTVEVSRFILAKVPGLDTTLPVDRAAGVPDANLIVHTTPVTREGYLATNKVVYSLMLGTDIGDFDFNWMGLVTAEGVLLIAAYVPLQQKRREIPPLQAGNNLTRNIVWEYDGAQSLSGITVPASTWQFDFTADFTAINAQLAELKTELDKKVDLTTWTPPQAVSLDGPVLVYPGSVNTYKITDYNRFSIFTAATTVGTVTIAADVLTLTIPANAPAGIMTLDVLRDGSKASFRLPVGAAAIVPPTITSPVNLATGVALDLVLTATAFEVFPAGFDHQVSRRWQIATDEAFTQLIFDKTSTTALTSIRPSDYDILMPPGKRLYARALDIGATLQTVAPVAISFNTATIYIRRPSITFPVDGQQGVTSPVTILSDAFSVYGGSDIHLESRYQLFMAPDATGLVSDSGWSTTNLTSYKPNSIVPNTQLYVRVKYKGKVLGETEWSSLVRFVTAKQLDGVYTQLVAGPASRSDAVMVSVDGDIYLQGGRYNNTGGATRSDLWKFSPGSGTWTQKTFSKALSTHVAVAINGLIYFYGGSSSADGTNYLNDLWIYNPTTGVVSAGASPAGGGRTNVLGCALNGRMYVAGGSMSGYGISKNLLCYNPANNTWSVLPDCPVSVWSLGAKLVAAAGKIFLLSGASTYCYDPESGEWTQKSNFPYVAFSNFGVVAVNDLIYRYGGYSNSIYYKTLSVYDPVQDSWKALPAGGYPRANPAIAEAGGSIYVFGGTNDTTYLTDFWRID